MENNSQYVWKDKKRTIFGLPWTFTTYKLTKDKLLIESGFLSKKEEEVRLYRIMDLTLNRPFWQRIWGLGTIHCCTADKSTPEFDVLKIKNAEYIFFPIWLRKSATRSAFRHANICLTMLTTSTITTQTATMYNYFCFIL